MHQSLQGGGGRIMHRSASGVVSTTDSVGARLVGRVRRYRGCPRYADVEVKLQVGLCNVYPPHDCHWKTLNKNESRIIPGGGRGHRTTAPILCSRPAALVSYLSMVDVDLVGQSDPPDKLYKRGDVLCRPLIW